MNDKCTSSIMITKRTHLCNDHPNKEKNIIDTPETLVIFISNQYPQTLF